jgi:hypothetical protein
MLYWSRSNNQSDQEGRIGETGIRGGGEGGREEEIEKGVGGGGGEYEGIILKPNRRNIKIHMS